ncbi:hypothetical protein B0H21DRAFT_61153 [Amylocystis lapponica]|nr:hypothetical protein B0H21DRAFT_61153 [Amylocystis lapponica]
MKGRDTQLVAILDILTSRFGVRLGLASLVCHVTGIAKDEHTHFGYNPWDDNEHESEESEDETLDMVEVTDVDVHLEYLVDFAGSLIKDRLDFDLETEVIPQDLVQAIQVGQHERRKYSGSRDDVRNSTSSYGLVV